MQKKKMKLKMKIKVKVKDAHKQNSCRSLHFQLESLKFLTEHKMQNESYKNNSSRSTSTAALIKTRNENELRENKNFN